MMKVFLKDNRLCISEENRITATDIKAYFKYYNAYGKTERLFSHGEWQLRENATGTEAKCDNALIVFTPCEKGMLIKTRLINDGPEIKKSEEFIPLCFYTDSPIERAVGSTIAKSGGNRTNEMGAEVKTCRPVYGEWLEFSDFSAYATENGNLTVSGFASSFNYFGNLGISADGMITLKQFTEYHPVASGEFIESDMCLILPCDDITEGITAFTDISAKYISSERGTELPSSFTVPCGYCTWYYYYQGITGEKVIRYLDVIKKYSDKIPLRYYQLDDGWFRTYGDWKANEKFPEGMKYYADKIKEAGLIPGIWISPLRVSQQSDIGRNHPEYCVRNRNPKPGEDSRHTEPGIYFLDYSVPEVCEYMAATVREITKDWGFGYIKVDLVTSSMGPHVYADPDFNACRNHIKCLEVIRNAAAEGTFILDCTAPFLGAVGLADGMRISGDIQGDWETLKDVFGRRVLKRGYYNNRFFTNDADCLIIRKPENEDEDCRHHCTRNDTEIKSYITAMAASGGALMLSDRLDLLSDEQIKLITYLFPQNLTPAIPLDFTEANLPGILDFGQREKIRIVALINWFDAPHTLSVNTGKKHVFEFWNREYKGISESVYSEEIEPHGCRVLFLTDVHEPAVVASDGCIVPNIKQNFDGEKLNFTFEKENESLYVAADNISGDGCLINKINSGLFKVTQFGDVFNVSLNLI